MFVADLYILIYFINILILMSAIFISKNNLGAILIFQIIQPYFSDIERILLRGNGKYCIALTREKYIRFRFRMLGLLDHANIFQLYTEIALRGSVINKRLKMSKRIPGAPLYILTCAIFRFKIIWAPSQYEQLNSYLRL